MTVRIVEGRPDLVGQIRDLLCREFDTGPELFLDVLALDELHRQVIEQPRVAGARTARAEVLEGLYEAAPEETLPVAVDRDARGQRVLG